VRHARNRNNGEDVSLTALAWWVKLGGFPGYGPRIVQSVLTSAILFLTKEKLFLYTVALLIRLRKATPAGKITPAKACAGF